MSSPLRRILTLLTLARCLGACDPDVVIGARFGEWCATVPIDGSSVQLQSERGSVVIPPGPYVVVYVSGAQIHDPEVGFEVTDQYYGDNSLRAGHHVFSGESPESSATSSWLDDEGLLFGGSLEEVESANVGHRWPLEHAGGELYIKLYDDYYGDNSGPGSTFCVRSP